MSLERNGSSVGGKLHLFHCLWHCADLHGSCRKHHSHCCFVLYGIIACVDEFLERLPEGYDTEMGQGGVNVAGGQKQRICIARALLKKPKVLILDDSTSAVDTATDAKIRTALAKEIPGTTKIIIAQRISSVEHADRILVLEDGRINAFDTHDNLLKNNAIYQEIYNSQLEGSGDFDQPA